MTPPDPGRLDDVTIEALGEQALLVRFGNRIDAELNRRVHRLASALRAARPIWLRDLVPAYATLGVFVASDSGLDDLSLAEGLIRECIASDKQDRVSSESGRVVDIPVRYGGEAGPDLDDVAALCRMSSDEVIARHVGATYRVAMLGFAPGFPYLLGLDLDLCVPRLAQPRRRVEAGSVAIGGAQTGIYPRPGPGGWRVIGRTVLPLFDAWRDSPSLLLPGDVVRFVRATEAA